MSKTSSDYPKEATINNFEQLYERALKIIQSAGWLPPLTLVTGIIVYLAVFLVFALPFLTSLPHPLPKSALYETLLIFWGVAFISSLIFAFWFAERWQAILAHIRIRKHKFPQYDELIFAECIITAYRLLKNNRRSAAKRVKYLVDDLSFFKNDFAAKDVFHEEANRGYGKEFSLLIVGKDSLIRMVLFSNAQVSSMLTSFGLAMVNKDDSVAYTSLQQIITEARKYGKLESRWRRIILGAFRIAENVIERKI